MIARTRIPGVFALTTLLPLIVATLCAAQDTAPLLNTVFQNHAVFQREMPIHVWGEAPPGETITIAWADDAIAATADAQGAWSAQLPATPPGGPYTLTVEASGGGRQSISDILVGDVFLCSGQSNMELPVSRTLNAPSEIRSASNERIRMLTVGKATSAGPLASFTTPVTWEVASPGTVRDWSATCYYFARVLQPYVDVPLGLINSSWGGSNIRAWMSASALADVGGHDEAVALLRLYAEEEPAAQHKFGERWQTWWHAQTEDTPEVAPWQPDAGSSWPLAPEGLGDWNTWGVADLQGFTGMVWYRATVTLTAAQAGQDAALSLGGIDEVDQTWINGHIVGNTFGFGTPRTYMIPADLLREGENVVVINVLNTWASGGLVGDPAQRALLLDGGDKIPLEEWRYQKVPAAVGYPPRAPWESVGGLTTIHNAMVAPLGPYGMKGALWYQGESNTGEAETYEAELRALIAQWRDQFGDDLPVLIVQLANYGRPSSTPAASGWAEVREAQRRATLDDPHAGYVVTTDIGDVYDIHPANKQEVGHRLARAARHVVYGEGISPSGPAPAHAARHGDTVTVTFEDVDGALVAYGNDAPIGFELCGTSQERCRYARARIDGSRVHLQADDVQEATRVRYCWADSPICTLYDTSGLPATPFELRIAD